MSNLPPGTVLDCVVAEAVYGATVYRCGLTWDDPGFPAWLETCSFPCLVVTPLGQNSKQDAVYYHNKETCCFGWSPSVNPDHALKLAATLERRGYWLDIHSPWLPKNPEQYNGFGGKWFGGFTPHGETGWNQKPDHASRGDTFAHCVCLAALKLMEAMKEDGEQQVGPEGRGDGTGS